MKCDKCKGNVEKRDERELNGQKLCEDCYIDLLSPPKACDPWAVYSAKSLIKESVTDITAIQSKILDILKETGGTDSKTLLEKLKITLSELEREIATLRHMEKVRGELRNGEKIFRLW